MARSGTMPVGKFPLPSKGVKMPAGPRGGGMGGINKDDLFRSLAKLRLLQKYGKSSGFEELLGDSG